MRNCTLTNYLTALSLKSSVESKYNLFPLLIIINWQGIFCVPIVSVKTTEATASYLQTEVSTERVPKRYGSGGVNVRRGGGAKMYVKDTF